MWCVEPSMCVISVLVAKKVAYLSSSRKSARGSSNHTILHSYVVLSWKLFSYHCNHLGKDHEILTWQIFVPLPKPRVCVYIVGWCPLQNLSRQLNKVPLDHYSVGQCLCAVRARLMMWRMSCCGVGKSSVFAPKWTRKEPKIRAALSFCEVLEMLRMLLRGSLLLSLITEFPPARSFDGTPSNVVSGDREEAMVNSCSCQLVGI